jgi:glycolate oxidase FAD binding subunit
LGDGKFAKATYRPDSVEDLCRIVREQAEAGHAIYPRGGGTALDYGGAPRRPGVSVDVRSLDQVIDYPAADMTITVQSGILMSTLGKILADQNQRLLVDAPEADLATLGGVFATNTSGPRRFGAGRPRDQIIGVSFVTADGNVVKGGGRVVKNVAGYDFPKLLTGSMGTLGILTQLTLKVRPCPETSAIAWGVFSSLKDAAAAVDSLNTSASRPMAIELLNPTAARMIGGPLDLPLGDVEWIVAIGLEDNRASVLWQIERLREELQQPSLAVREGEEAAPLWTALTDFQALRPGTVTMTANVPPSAVAEFVSSLESDRWAVQTHAGNGIVRAHSIADVALEPLAKELDGLRKSAVGFGGNLTLSRCPTDWKPRLKVWGDPRPDWKLAEGIKNALDPQGVLNPGRFVGTI